MEIVTKQIEDYNYNGIYYTFMVNISFYEGTNALDPTEQIDEELSHVWIYDVEGVDEDGEQVEVSCEIVKELEKVFESEAMEYKNN